ncbi:urease accessory protein UreD [Paenibacillus alvei]|uniref:urease accessory protein UreD n=1 Tax=Paenibacillus alvei TaxID=44250 RepID=UPI0018CCBF1D|nr:urease accessory protein UreD [Paenibacillus alvei]MBG9733078.1 urease accessory protein UreD [Paenibacillus alvei]MBG9744914.1 urease accessory protein UreD [Paenibacillus alvei]MCY9581776.1 urease accessory protein UreD [Paenibacillus alvei]MCY9586888.1 urease accessory protein UreD [Paenibacillus alvei]
MEEWTGVLRLNAEERSGKTVARDVYFHGAFKVMRPIYHDDSGQACYYILNPGGGYLDGDRYLMQISLEEGARITLTTQAATKIYKTPKKPAYQEVEIRLKKGSYLEYITDPIIGYEHARYKQKTVIWMEKGANLLYSEIVTSGWSPDGRQFSYDLLQFMNEIYLDGVLAVHDHIKLNPAAHRMTSLGFMEGYSHLGSMMMISEQVDQDFLDRLYLEIDGKSEDCRIGLSLLPVSGLMARVLANSTQTIEAIFACCHRFINQSIFNTTPSSLRKY